MTQTYLFRIKGLSRRPYSKINLVWFVLLSIILFMNEVKAGPSCPFPAQSPYNSKNINLARHHEGVLKTSGGSIFYRYFNQRPGPLLILIPGLPSALYWSLFAERWSESGFNVLMFDYPGKMNTVLNSRADLDFLRLQVKELFNHLKVDFHADWHLVGTSMGGPLAASLVEEHESRVRSLVLLNPVGLKRDWTFLQQLARVPIVNLVVAPFVIQEEVKAEIAAGLACPENFQNLLEEQEQFLETLGNRWNYLNLIAHYGMRSHIGIFEELNSLSVPVLVASGEPEHDRLFGQIDQLKSILPRAHYEMIPKSSHIPFIENPGATFDLMYSFILSHKRQVKLNIPTKGER